MEGVLSPGIHFRARKLRAKNEYPGATPFLFEYLKMKHHEHILPLIVFEGTSNRKIEKISEHFYLVNALNCLKYLEGSLFIFGHSLDPSDDHTNPTIYCLLVHTGYENRNYKVLW